MTLRYKSHRRSRCYQLSVSMRTPVIPSINTHIVQHSAQPATNYKFPVRSSAGHKTFVSIPAGLLTGDLRALESIQKLGV